jgi:hypothetical protein
MSLFELEEYENWLENHFNLNPQEEFNGDEADYQE